MAITETKRAALTQALAGTIGEEHTETLMSCILPEGRDHLATKDDLTVLETKMEGGFAEVNGRIDGLEGRMDGRMDGLAGRIDGRMDGLAGRIDGLEAKIDGKFAESKGYTDSVVARQTRTLLVAMAVGLTATWGAILATYFQLAAQI